MSEVKILERASEFAQKYNLDLKALPLRDLGEKVAILGELFRKGYFPSILGWSEKDLPALQDPRVTYPWAKSILVFAQPYSLPPSEKFPLPSGVIAPFCALDWYGLLKDKLRKIKAELLVAFPQLKVKVFVEGKLLEKTWAELAGIGWRGKNSLLYSEKWGSRFLLGELLISAEVGEFKKEKESMCGDCRICLDACPIGAITKPYQVRPSLCLDYFTLHYEGVLPLKIRELMGERLFGCSTCQDVCPYNREWKEVKPQPESGPGLFIPIQEALLMNEEKFHKKFSGHTFKGKTLLLLKRNAIVVAGNLRDRSLFELVEPYAYDSPSLLRQHALWSLWRMDSRRASSIFQRVKSWEKIPRILREIEFLERDA